MNSDRLLEYCVVSPEEMAAWPVDRKTTGEKLWAETTWGGDAPGRPKLFNWNIWPSRVVFQVDSAAEVVRGEALWRRSARAIRQKGLKLLSAATNERIADVRLAHYDQERVAINFRPVTGPGIYHLYYGATEPPLFEPDPAWRSKAESVTDIPLARAVRIEERCALDGFFPMETIALRAEVERLLKSHPDAAYLVFPEDRNRPIKLLFDIPAHWALEGPKREIALAADRNEYRVFQLGIWACRDFLPNVAVRSTDLRSASGNILAADRLQCLTLQSRIKSLYIERPKGLCPVPKGQTRALWFGIDIPEDAGSGEYRGTLTVSPSGHTFTELPIRLTISNTVAPERGDHDLHCLSRLRWMESDVGLSDKVYPPYRPLTLSKANRRIRAWGHTLALNAYGLPEGLWFGRERIIASPMSLTGACAGTRIAWRAPKWIVTEATEGHVGWCGSARSGDVQLFVEGRMEYDGCVVVTLKVTSAKQRRIENVSLSVAWLKAHAELASGMGYRGRRDGDRLWRQTRQAGDNFRPSLWLGSMKAGLGFVTWVRPPSRAGMDAGNGEADAWEDATRLDAATVTEQGGSVVMRLNLGAHNISPTKEWRMQFALRPTPVKPPDPRHWQFRYLHKGGDFAPSADDTPQSFLKDNCRRLDELKALGVKRLNLHDWWGPAFNYPWQWEGPDNLARLTAEAHKRGIFVKVYNSGRELSALAPEFWALVYEGAHYRFPDAYKTNPEGLYQDAWHANHLPDGLPEGWPRLPPGLGNEHTVPVSNATRNGNFYLESMRYMTRFFGTDGAYWDGADGPTLGHREMAKRLWAIFRETNPDAAIDVHHGNSLLSSPMTDHMLCFPFIDSIWHGEQFDYDRFDPWTWLVEISGLPFGIPSELLGGEEYFARGMLFGIWPRAGWGGAGTEKQRRLWAFFDRFGIEQATLRGWWERHSGVIVSRPETVVTAFLHPKNGVLLVIASWHPPITAWQKQTIDVSLLLDCKTLGLPKGPLSTVDILTDETLDVFQPIPLPNPKEGRLLWVRGKR